jgi:hypothetical protein
MRYIVVDLYGASRLSFRSLSDARDWAHSLSEQEPERLNELLIERFNQKGELVGESQWADEFLRELGESMVPFERGDGSLVSLRADLTLDYPVAFQGEIALQGSWSGMAKPNAVAFLHQHEHAIGTPCPAQGERAVG